MPASDRVAQQLERLIEKGRKVANDADRQNMSYEEYRGWIAQLEHFLIGLLGAKAPYLRLFEDTSTRLDVKGRLAAYLGIASAVREDVQHGVLSVRRLIEAEVFADFIEMADELLAASYKDAAAVLVGAVLEDGLRRIADVRGIEYSNRDGIASLNEKLAKDGAYSALVRGKITLWTTLRNSAAHGHFGEFNAEDVRSMVRGVSDFLSEQLR